MAATLKTEKAHPNTPAEMPSDLLPPIVTIRDKINELTADLQKMRNTARLTKP